MATSIVSPPRNISSSVTLLDNISHYDPFLRRSPHSLKIKAPLTVQEQRIFFAERFNVVPIFAKTQAMLGGRSARLFLPVISPRAVPLATMPTSIMSQRRPHDQPRSTGDLNLDERKRLIRRRLEVAKSNAVSPGKGGKQPDIVGLVVQRRLRDRPRIRRPRVIELKIRLGRRLR